MSDIIPIEKQIPAFALPESDLIKTLQASLYPGAHADSVKLVLGYCRAQRLDPMQKPVHIVPMKVKVGTSDDGKAIYADRDVVMPGIGLYRSQASRSAQHMGTSDPEFGPTKTLTFTDEVWEDNGRGGRTKRRVEATIEYPEWCRVTVRRRLPTGEVGEFSATEYWLENYATAGRYTDAPNAMWRRRPRGQIAKCSEAQALRKAFPEFGSEPTAEEMEGKPIDLDERQAAAPATNEFMPAAKPAEKKALPASALDVDPVTGETTAPATEPASGSAGAGGEEPARKPASDAPADAGELISAGMAKTILSTMARKQKDEAQFVEKFGFQVASTPNARRNEVMAWARS